MDKIFQKNSPKLQTTVNKEHTKDTKKMLK